MEQYAASFKVTTDRQATFYPKNRFSLNSVILFSISILILKNNKTLRLTSGIRVPTLQKYSYFEFWPKIVSYLREAQKIFLRLSLMLMRYFIFSALEQQMVRPNAGIYYWFETNLKIQSCQLLNWLKRSEYLQIVMANTEWSNIKDTFEK